MREIYLATSYHNHRVREREMRVFETDKEAAKYLCSLPEFMQGHSRDLYVLAHITRIYRVYSNMKPYSYSREERLKLLKEAAASKGDKE